LEWNQHVISVAADGLNISTSINGWQNIYAAKGFSISGPLIRVDGFPGTILYYFTMKSREMCGQCLCVNKKFDHFSKSFSCIFGLSDVSTPLPDDSLFGEYPNSYAIPTALYNLKVCWLAGERPPIEFPEGAIRQPKSGINVNGCGLVLDPEAKLWIFFTLNGKVFGELVWVVLRINIKISCIFPINKL
jgi:hypothetical protein